MLRQDFVAVIKTENESGNEVYEKVMIEVQKSPIAPEISRFRHYIADKYRRKSTVEGAEKYIPIKTIYLVEEVFNAQLPAVLGRRGTYYDELENTQYSGERDSLVELFNHDSWFIQTELLPPEFKDELYYVLSVFAPNYRTSRQDRYIVIENEELLIKKHRILERILRRLQAATQNTEVNTAVEMEIDYEKYIENIMHLAEQAEAKVEQAEAKIEQAEAKIEQAEAKIEQAEAKIEQAEAKVEQAEAKVEQAEAKIEQERQEKERERQEKETALLKAEIYKLHFVSQLSAEQIAQKLSVSVDTVSETLNF
jgi:multidrug resistance efflux pump